MSSFAANPDQMPVSQKGNARQYSGRCILWQKFFIAEKSVKKAGELVITY